MLSATAQGFREAFAAERDELLALFLRSVEDQRTLGEPSFHSDLSAFAAKVLPAFASHLVAIHGYSQIFAHLSARWEYRNYYDCSVDRGAPSIIREHPLPVLGVELIPIPEDEYQSGGWELYWLADETLLYASRTAHHYLNPGNQSSNLEIEANWIERNFTPLSLDGLASQLSVPQICTVLCRVLSEWQQLSTERDL